MEGNGLLLGVFEDKEAPYNEEAPDESNFVDSGRLLRKPTNQKMQADYTAKRPVLTDEEQKLVVKLEKGAEKKLQTDQAGLKMSGPTLIPRKKPRRTVDDIIAEDERRGKPWKRKISDDRPIQEIVPKLQAYEADRSKRSKTNDGTWSYAVAGQPAGSPLHHEIAAFAVEATPSRAEKLLLEQTVSVITKAAKSIWPQCRVGVFGSQATHTSMPGSDVDVTILHADTASSAGQSDKLDKQICLDRLTALRVQLNIAKVLDRSYPVNLINARVPIIKCKIRPPQSEHSMRADISIGLTAPSGLDAAALIQNYSQAFPPMRPLVLILKRLLKEKNMHEVATGGLSSYSLINMVIAHLQAEGYVMTQDGHQLQAGVGDLGNLLWGFLMRYGDIFDYYDHAISIVQGGVVTKRPSCRSRLKPWALVIENPLEPGKDVSGGSYRIRDVKEAFKSAGMSLDMSVKTAQGSGMPRSEQASWAHVQAEGQHSNQQLNRFPILSSIINAELALS